VFDTLIAVGDAGEGGESSGDVVKFRRGNGGGAEGRAIAESTSVEHRAEAADKILIATRVQITNHVRLVATDLVSQGRERPLAERDALL
jgi:hypothetical protein